MFLRGAHNRKDFLIAIKSGRGKFFEIKKANDLYASPAAQGAVQFLRNNVYSVGYHTSLVVHMFDRIKRAVFFTRTKILTHTFPKPP